MSGAEQRRFKMKRPKIRKLKRQILPNLSTPGQMLPRYICDSGQKNFKKFADTTLMVGASLALVHRTRTSTRNLLRKPSCTGVWKSWFLTLTGIQRVQVTVKVWCLTQLLCCRLIEKDAHGSGLNFRKIWKDQSLSPVLEAELDRIGATVSKIITAPAYETIDIEAGP